MPFKQDRRIGQKESSNAKRQKVEKNLKYVDHLDKKNRQQSRFIMLAKFRIYSKPDVLKLIKQIEGSNIEYGKIEKWGGV